MNTIDLSNYKHLLFDYDGLLVDSESLYYETWAQLLTEEGKQICKSFHRGKHESEVYEKIKPYLIEKIALKDISPHRQKRYDQMVSNGQLITMEGIKELLNIAYGRISMSIVSNSTYEVVVSGLSATGLDSYFQKLYCYNKDISRKPAPDLYKIALKDLNIKLSDCLAFEDSESGITSALMAKIPVIAIGTKDIQSFCIRHSIPWFRSAKDLIKQVQLD